MWAASRKQPLSPNSLRSDTYAVNVPVHRRTKCGLCTLSACAVSCPLLSKPYAAPGRPHPTPSPPPKKLNHPLFLLCTCPTRLPSPCRERSLASFTTPYLCVVSCRPSPPAARLPRVVAAEPVQQFAARVRRLAILEVQLGTARATAKGRCVYVYVCEGEVRTWRAGSGAIVLPQVTCIGVAAQQTEKGGHRKS